MDKSLNQFKYRPHLSGSKNTFTWPRISFRAKTQSAYSAFSEERRPKKIRILQVYVC